jgi:hypothetical protein
VGKKEEGENFVTNETEQNSMQKIHLQQENNFCDK